MERKKDTAAVLEWRDRYLSKGILQEEDYDQALRRADELEHCGMINTMEWVQLVRLANAALLRLQ